MAVRLRTGHTHGLARFTSVDRDHRHLVLNISDRAVVRNDGSHVHLVRSLTTFDRLHAHAVRLFTGPGIPRLVPPVTSNTGTRYGHAPGEPQTFLLT